MDSVENRSKLYSILSSLDKGDNKSIGKLLKGSVDESELHAVKKLKNEVISKTYGKYGLERYIRSVLDCWEDYIDTARINEAGSKKRHILSSILLSPAKLIAKTYDYLFSKTNSHLFSTASLGALVGEFAEIATFVAETDYYSPVLQTPFNSLLIEEFMANWPVFVEVPIITGLVSALSVLFMIAGTSRVFNYKKLSIQEIEDDIKKYNEEFKDTFKIYNKAFFNAKIEPSLKNLNALYMLSSTNAYMNAKDSDEKLREYEKSMLPYISKVLKKSINPKLIVHHSPKSVGGFTLVYNSIFGKLIKSKSYSPVFVNTERFNAVPEYLFALFHELAHGAGATTEQMASYYAEIAMDYAKEDFPLEGYDLFLSVNRLESAVATLSKKFRFENEFFSELEKLGVPSFIKESFNYNFNPRFSITFPLHEALYGSTVESKFSGLYASGPYIAKKMVEKGIIKTF